MSTKPEWTSYNITGFNGSFKILAYLLVGLPLYDPDEKVLITRPDEL